MRAPGPAYDLEAWRRRIPLLDHAIPLNNCSHAPPLDATLAAAERFMTSWRERGMDWDGWMEEVEGARAAFARLINAEPEHIAVTTSVSAATSSLASALDFRSGRRKVLVSSAEFPSVGHVWLAQAARGAEVDHVPAAMYDGGMDAWDRALDDRTLIVSAATAWYQNGAHQNIEALVARSHARGARVFVDAYQTLGASPLDVRALGVDALASGCLKYLLGIPGLAFLYIRPDWIERLHPAVTGWFGRQNPFAFDLARLDWSGEARRFDTGTPPILNAYVCRAGMQVINAIGPVAIEGWIHRISARAIAGGERRGLAYDGPAEANRKSPTTAFRCRDAHDVEHRLRDAGILASARGPVIRLAPHFYTREDEIDTALDRLADILAKDPP